jgi:hypothetical protein
MARDGVRLFIKIGMRTFAHGIGERDIEMNATSGTFLGVDEQFGMLVQAERNKPPHPTSPSTGRTLR